MGNGCPIAIRSVKLVFLIVLVTMTVANPLREDDTHLVMKSMNEFLHHLFPLVPTKTQYVWEITHQEPVLPWNITTPLINPTVMVKAFLALLNLGMWIRTFASEVQNV
ncbi:uncharacterized protein LOC143249914 [Tachypleus tridentatus]|uniref:uncharacterized protein LOC143249914 n=1 Tax=Tachypleus tridentatus TaxID=6853 RepID=UPI003FD3A4B5